MPDLQGSLVFTISFVWKGKQFSGNPTILGLSSDQEAKELFEGAYRVAHPFMFNDVFLHGVEVAYLGVQFVVLGGALGRSRIDVIQSAYPTLEANIVSLHVKPALDLATSGNVLPPELLRDVALFLSTSLYGQQSNLSAVQSCLDTVRNRVAELAPKRHYTLPYSVHTYLSVHDMPEAGFDQHRENFAAQIYGLLFAHAEGVSPAGAKAYLEKSCWSSTSFFVHYYQPGAIVTFSRGYPSAQYGTHRDHFLQTRLNQPAGSRTGIAAAAPSPTGGAVAYDMASEYPPLRYVGLLPGLFAAIFEDNLRHAYSALLKLQEEPTISWRFWRLIYRERDLNRITVSWAKSDNFEYLKLPVTRSLVAQLIDAKLQGNVIENSRELKSSNLNALVFVLTIIATVIALLQAVPFESIGRYLGLGWTPFVDTAGQWLKAITSYF